MKKRNSTVTVLSLVGKNIAGMMANVTNPAYRSQYANDPKNHGGRIRKLLKIEWRRERGYKWLYLLWERDTTDMSDCGYSGWRDDSTSTPTVELLPKEEAL